MTATVLTLDLIVSDPAIRSGKPILAGTALRVSDIAAYHVFGGLTPDDLAVQFRLTLGQVYAALAFYYTHRAQIDEEFRANAQEAEALRQQLKAQGRLLTLE
jgi:uncharacterized protein (DUF433 family)